MSHIDWGKLLERNQCKAFGIPWTEEENYAVHVLRVPADYVRQGCLTIEEYEKKLGKNEASIAKTGKIQLVHLRKDQLAMLCAKYDIQILPETPRASMLEALMNIGLPKSIPIDEFTI